MINLDNVCALNLHQTCYRGIPTVHSFNWYVHFKFNWVSIDDDMGKRWNISSTLITSWDVEEEMYEWKRRESGTHNWWLHHQFNFKVDGATWYFLLKSSDLVLHVEGSVETPSEIGQTALKIFQENTCGAL